MYIKFMATWKVKIKYGDTILYDGDLNQVAWNKSLTTTGKFLNNNISVEYYKNSTLPDEFQEVEYIQSSGTQYIDTNIVPSTIYNKITASLARIGSSSGTVFGHYADSSAYKRAIVLGINSSGYGFGVGTNNESTYKIESDYIFHALYAEANNGTYTYGIDDNISTVSYVSVDNSGNEYIFAFHDINEETPGNMSSFKLASFRIYTDSANNVVRDYIPCYCLASVTAYQGSTATTAAAGTIGLYDLIESKFYINSGSGTFTKGPDV